MSKFRETVDSDVALGAIAGRNNIAHNKGRKGQKKIRVRAVGSKVYPHRMERCISNIAPSCKIWVNANTMPSPGVCKRCWQTKNSQK